MADVTDNRGEQRFELATPDGPAFADYEDDGGVLVFTHTVVPEGQRGHGVGNRLVAGALDLVRHRGETIVAECPFVADYVEAHPEVQDLLARF